MMQFFRKYQRYFIIALSSVTIVSFSFFGTYSSMMSQESVDPILFHDLLGHEVKASKVNAMVRFLSSDSTDQITLGGILGPNFLNDGFIRKDIIESGFAPMLAEPFMDQMHQDLAIRQDRQKNYKPYAHPYIKGLSAQNVWKELAPEVSENLAKMKLALNDQELFKTQLSLYLAEQKFPSYYLKQVIRYQETQGKEAHTDPGLAYADLNLFGYHSLEDWFGPSFIQLSAQFVHNFSIIAEEKGIKVSDDEALAELLYNNEISYRKLKNAKSPHLQVRNSQEYFKEQLRILGLDQKTATAIWKQVVTCRKYLKSLSDGVALDSKTLSDERFAQKKVHLNLFSLDQSFNLKSEEDLQRFETYITLIGQARENPLDMPSAIKSISEIKESAPELLKTHYVVNLKSVSAKEIQLKATLKEVWDWELDPKNWPQMLIKFPMLGTTFELSRESKLNILDNLSSEERILVDQFARSQILKAHPEWIDEALAQIEFTKTSLTFKEKGSNLSIGIKNAKALKQLLDSSISADLNDELTIEAKQSLTHYSEDEKTYFHIELIEKEENPSVLLFSEAIADGSLNTLKDKISLNLEGVVKCVLAEADRLNYPWHESCGMTQLEFAAKFRFINLISSTQEELKENLGTQVIEAVNKQLVTAFTHADNQEALLNQFKVAKSELTVSTNNPEFIVDDSLYAKKAGELSTILFDSNRGSYFYEVIAVEKDENAVAILVKKAQKELASSLIKQVLSDELSNMVIKNAIQLDKSHPVSDL